MTLISLTIGYCEVINEYPSARGTVIDARSEEPIPAAEVIRETSYATNKTTTDALGRFHLPGKRHVQAAIGDRFWHFPKYRISAPGYQPLQTNGFPTNVVAGGIGRGPANQDLGELRLNPSSALGE